MSRKVWINSAAWLNLKGRFAAIKCPFSCSNSGTEKPLPPPLLTLEFQEDDSVPKGKVLVRTSAGVLDSSRKALVSSSLKPFKNNWRDVIAGMVLEKEQKWDKLIKKAKEARAAKMAASPSSLKPFKNDWRDVIAGMELEKKQKWDKLIKKVKEARAAKMAASPSLPLSVEEARSAKTTTSDAAAPSLPAASVGTSEVVPPSDLQAKVAALTNMLREIRSDVKDLKKRAGLTKDKKDSDSDSNSSDDKK